MGASEYTIAGIIIAVIGLLKYPQFLDLLKAWMGRSAAEREEIIAIYEKQLRQSEERELIKDKKIEELQQRLEKKVTRSRSKK